MPVLIMRLRTVQYMSLPPTQAWDMGANKRSVSTTEKKFDARIAYYKHDARHHLRAHSACIQYPRCRLAALADQGTSTCHAWGGKRCDIGTPPTYAASGGSPVRRERAHFVEDHRQILMTEKDLSQISCETIQADTLEPVARLLLACSAENVCR